MTKTIEIDGKAVTFRATAAIPRLYRIKFGRDILQDMTALKSAMEAAERGEGSIPPKFLQIFEDVSYLMAKHADPNMEAKSPEEWLDGFNTFSIYQVLPQIIELWGLNTQTDVQAKKNFARLTGK